MRTLVGDVPIFDFFSVYPFALAEAGEVQPSRHVIGTLSSIHDIDALVPAAHWRIEIEREGDMEEVRVVNSRKGEYHVAQGAVAVRLITELDRRRNELHEVDGPAFPPGLDANEKADTFWTCIIQYDHEGYRIFPPIKYGGEVDDAEFERLSEGSGSVYATPEFVGVLDSRTGVVWKASEDLAGRILASEEEDAEGAVCGQAFP